MYIFCVIMYVIIFRVLSFMLSFDVIIFHGQQMLSFLCYHFSLYLLGVIIYVIIWCYHLLLSFPPFYLFPENVTHSEFVDLWQGSTVITAIWDRKTGNVKVSRQFKKKKMVHKNGTNQCRCNFFSNVEVYDKISKIIT